MSCIITLYRGSSSVGCVDRSFVFIPAVPAYVSHLTQDVYAHMRRHDVLRGVIYARVHVVVSILVLPENGGSILDFVCIFLYAVSSKETHGRPLLQFRSLSERKPGQC